jgi:hypothetical protein
VLLGSNGAVLEPFGALDCTFEFTLNFFAVSEVATLAWAGILELVSCNDAEGAVAAGLGLSFGMTAPGVVDAVAGDFDFDVDFALPEVRVIL